MSTGGSFPGVKRQERDVHHSPPTSAEVKKTWIYTSAPPYVFMAQWLVKQRDNITSFNFTFTLRNLSIPDEVNF
jgi:hypothetical protein